MNALPLLAALAVPALAAEPAAVSTAAVRASTAPARAPTIEDLFGGDRLRHPFQKVSGSAALAPVKEFDPEELSIHALELKGIMTDKSGPMALLFDPATGASLILRGGRLHGPKKKPVRGIKGTIKADQKSVTLMTEDKDVQTLRLGEAADEAEE